MIKVSLLLALLLGLAACAPAAAPSTSTPIPATKTPVPSPTDTPIPTQTGTPSATPTPEALHVTFAGVTLPTSVIGGDSYLDSSIIFRVPADWMQPLPADRTDPNPLVPSGDIGGYHMHGGVNGSETAHYENFGVDFRGILLAEPGGDGHQDHDLYVAGFSFIDPRHPDKMYLLTMPVTDESDAANAASDIMPDGVFLWQNFPPGTIIENHPSSKVITLLKDPSSIGRRMVITMVSASTFATVYKSPDYPAFADAIAKGKRLPIGLDIRIFVRYLHIPQDMFK